MSGILFAGDAVGVRLPDAGVLRPSTPPPDFDLDQAVHSLHRFAERAPDRPRPRPLRACCPSRGAVLGEAEETLRRWAASPSRRGATARTSPPRWRGLRFRARRRRAEHREKLDTLNGVHSNAAGFRRWLETRDGASSTTAESSR